MPLKAVKSVSDPNETGRIVNRFGKDLDAIDMTIPQSVRQWISCVLRVIGTLVVLGTWPHDKKKTVGLNAR